MDTAISTEMPAICFWLREDGRITAHRPTHRIKQGAAWYVRDDVTRQLILEDETFPTRRQAEEARGKHAQA